MKKSNLAIASAALLLAIAAGCTQPSTSSSAPASSSTVQPSTSTSSVDTKQESLDGAAEYLYQANKDKDVTTGNFTLPAKQSYDGKLYDVEWKLEVTSGPAANITLGSVGEDNFIPVTVVYDAFASTQEVAYTLTATLKDGEGRTATTILNRTIPAFKYTSHADYLAAEAKELINVEGYVVGYYPVYQGTTQVFIESAKGEGYYVYKLPVRETEKVKTAKKALADAEAAKEALADTATDADKKAADDAIKAAEEAYNAVLDEQAAEDFASGKYIIVSGKKDIYSGTAEIVSPSYQMSPKAPVTVEPYDITTMFSEAKSIKDATLINLQGSLVTIKDVTLTTIGGSKGDYLQWTKDGKNSYVRISSSGNVSDHDEKAKETLLGNYPSKFGFKADVTGIVTQYNGSFYLMPTSKDSIKVTGTAMEPTFAIDYAKENLTVDAEIFSNLPNTVEGFDGSTITWASTAEGVVAQDGKVTPKAEPVTTTLTATIKIGDQTATKEFKDVVVKLPDVSSLSTVAAAIKAADGTTPDLYVVEGVIVAKDGSNRPYIMDEKGNVMVVFNNSNDSLKNAPIGSTVKLAGYGSLYNGLHQFGSTGTLTVLSVSETTSAVEYGTATPIDAAAYTKAVLTDKDQSMGGKYVKLTGVELRKSGNYFNLYYTPEGGSEVQIQLQSNGMNDTLATLDGKDVVVYGYSYGCNSTVARITAVKIEEATGEEDDTPDTPAVEVKTSVSIANHATANSWVNGTLYASISIDENITVSTSGTPVGNYSLNTGKYYTSGNNWRIYQNESPEIVVTASAGHTIKSVKITYAIKNTGVLTKGTTQITSGTVVEVNAASVTFGVGNTGTATNGQVQITAIEVIYE